MCTCSTAFVPEPSCNAGTELRANLWTTQIGASFAEIEAHADRPNCGSPTCCFLPTLRRFFVLIAVLLKKLKRASCLALSSKYHTSSPVMTSAQARRSRESKSEKLNVSVCADPTEAYATLNKEALLVGGKNYHQRLADSTNRATAVNVNRLWERRRKGRDLRDSVTAIHIPLWSVFEQISVAYVLIFWHLTWVGKWFEDFQVHRSFRKINFIVVRGVVSDDRVEILCVVLGTTHAKLEIFLAFTT